LTAGFNVEQDPLRTSLARTGAGEIAELTLVWLLEPYRVYHFRAKQIRHSDENCNYFDLALSVTTLSYLKTKYTCLPNYPRLIDVLPPQITQRDLPFSLTKTVQIEYPTDFEADASSFVADTLIESESEVEVSGKLEQ